MPTITLSSPRVFSVAFFDLARIESETRSSEAKLTPMSPFENLESDITPPQVFLLHIQFLSAEPLRAGTRPCPSLHAALLSTPHPLAPSPVPHSRLGNHQPHSAQLLFMSAAAGPEDEKMKRGGRSITFAEGVIYAALTSHTPANKQLFTR